MSVIIGVDRQHNANDYLLTDRWRFRTFNERLAQINEIDHCSLGFVEVFTACAERGGATQHNSYLV